jgi:hypothetical protein
MSGWTPPGPLDQPAPVSGWIPRGTQPRHGQPRGNEQQQATARSRVGVSPAGFDVPSPRRGAHALPDDDDLPSRAGAARGGYEAPAAYGSRQGYPTTGYPSPTQPARHGSEPYRGYEDRFDPQEAHPPRPSRPVSGSARPVSGLARPVSGAAVHPAPVSGAARYSVPVGAPAHHATSAPPRPTYPTAGYPPPPYRETEPPRGGWAPTSGGGVGLSQSRPATDPRLRVYADGYDNHGRHPQSDLLTPSGNIPRYVDPPGNRPAAVGFAFGFTPLTLIALILGIVGLVRAKAARKGRGLAIAAIVMSIAWLPVTYLTATHVLAHERARSAATPAPSPSSALSPGYDPGCASADAAAYTFNKNLQAHANNAGKLLVDFKTAATALNAAAAQSERPAAASAMKKLASDLTTIYTSLTKGTAPNGTVMNRLDADGSAIDKACGK